MKALLRHLPIYFSLLIASSLFATTISSKSTGGDWGLTSTWNGGVIPGASDDVVINGSVLVGNNACSNLTISYGSSLSNHIGYGRTLSIYGNAVNNGTIFGGGLNIHCYGNITNNGVWSNAGVVLKATGVTTISQASGKYFEATTFTNDGVMDTLRLGSNVTFKKLYFNADYRTGLEIVIATNGYNLTFDSCNVNYPHIYSNDVINFNGSKLGAVQFRGNTSIDGITTVGNGCVSYDNFTVLGTLKHLDGYAISMNFYGLLTNKGSIGGIYLYLNGDLHNEGTYKPSQTYLQSGNSHKFSQTSNKFFEGVFQIKGTDTIILQSDISFSKIWIYGDLNSTPYGGINTNGYKLTLDECSLRGFNFYGSNAINLDKSYLENVHVHNDAELSGNYTIYTVYFDGNVTNKGTIKNLNGYGVVLYVYGKLTNEGTIQDASSGYIRLELFNDLHNSGIYKPKYTQTKGKKTIKFSQTAGTFFEGTFETYDTLDVLQLESDVVFKKIRLDGTNTAPYSTINANGHTLILDSSDVSEINFVGNDTFNLNGSRLYNWFVLGDAFLEGKITLYNNTNFNGEVTNNGILLNQYGYSVPVNINGKFINNGQVIDNSSGYLNIQLNNDLVNNGIYNPSYTQLKLPKTINLSQAPSTYFQGRFETFDTLNVIKLGSNVVFKKVRFNGTNTTPYSSINANGFMLLIDSSYITALRFEGNDSINLNGSTIAACSFNGNSTLLGHITLANLISFNGNITNAGVIENDNGYPRYPEFIGTFINNGTIKDNNSGYINVQLKNDLQNNGVYSPAYTQLKAQNIKLSQAENTYFESTFESFDTLDIITLGSDLVFKKIRFDGTNTKPYSTLNTKDFKLFFDSSYITELRFEGDDSINLNGSIIAACSFDGNSTLLGNITLANLVNFNGNITNAGVMENDNGYPRYPEFNGKFINNGTIKNNNSGYINVQLKNDLQNNGIYKPAYTQLKTNNPILLSQGPNAYFEGTFESYDTLNVIQLASDITFKKATLNGQNTQPYSTIKTNGFALKLDSCKLYEWQINSNDTVDFNGTKAANIFFINSPSLDGAITLEGNMTFTNKATILGTITNQSGYGRYLYFLGDLKNEGEISSNASGYLYVDAFGSILNNSIYQPYSTGLLGKTARTIAGNNAKGIKGYFYLKDTITLKGENYLPHLEISSNAYLTIDNKASLICNGFSNARNSEITNLGRINVTKEIANYYSNYYYQAKTSHYVNTDIQSLLVESYGTQQHPATESAVNMWWRLKPTPAEAKDTLSKLELTYIPSLLNGNNEQDLRVYFSPNAGLKWDKVLTGVTLDTAKNLVTITNAKNYGHYILSTNDLGIISFTPVIQRAEPKVVGNKGQVTVYGFGIGLNDSMNVYLKRAGSQNIVADTVYLTDAIGESFIAKFNVDKADIGTYTMVLELAGQADLQLTDYFTIENAERPEPWVALGGRNKFLINRWQTFTINYGNKANTDAIGVPLFFVVNHIDGMEVDFPDFQIGIPKSFIDDGWTQWKDTAIELYFTSDELAGFEGKNMRVYAFYVPTISAMSSESVRVKIKVPSVANLDMTVWITDPMYEGIPNKQKAGTPPEVSACIAAAAGKYVWDKAIGFIPGYDCYKLAYKVTETGVGEVLKDPNEPEKPSTWFSWGISAWGWAWSIADCAGDLIPVTKGVKIGKDLIDIVFDMKGNYDATQDCWDKFKAKQKGKFGSKGVYSFDPNEIAGPSGYGADGYIEANADMVYTIYFENKDSATAAAQEVVVLDTLDKTKFDFNTLSFQDITIADSTYDIQSFAKEFRIIIDLAPRIQTLVQVTGSLDTASGQLKVSYVTLDRSTMELQEDVDLGFLPPNKTKPQGEGNFSYTIALKPNLAHDAQIINKALIFFDGNKPIATNVHSNKIDKLAPSSMVSGLPIESKDSSFIVSWSGSDPGCGIQNYTVMVAVNDSDFVVWKSNTSLTSDTYFGRNKTRYAFYSIATDSLGLTEGVSDESDASTYVKVNTGAVSSLDKEQITIATNAAANILNISLTEPGNVIVYDINGKQLLQSKLNAGSNTLPIAQLTPQSYVVVVQTNSTMVNKKIVVLPR